MMGINEEFSKGGLEEFGHGGMVFPITNPKPNKSLFTISWKAESHYNEFVGLFTDYKEALKWFIDIHYHNYSELSVEPYEELEEYNNDSK